MNPCLPGAIEEGFAGPGGWDEGARLIGVTGIVGREKDKAACDTAIAAGFHRDLCDLTALDYTGLTAWGYIGSPPCQAWSRAGKRQGILDQPRIFAHLELIIAAGEWIDYPRDGWHDDRSPLVLEVVRAIMHLRPVWIALEQVPDVLPFWQRVAVLLSELGYRVHAAILDAEMYGVPQTRDRAILTASLDSTHNVSRPPATHERYRPNAEAVADLFGELLPCVSMADALGWGMTERPSITVTAGGGRQGGPDPLDGGSGARATLKRAQAEGRYAWRRNRSQAFLDENPRRDHPANEPAPVIDSKARSATWVMCSGGQTQPQTAGTRPRPIDEPSQTILGGGSAAWVAQRPATTIQGDPRVARPGHRDREGGQRQFDQETVRVSVTEAAILQSFRADYPWQGSRTKQFEQVGNAIPPLLAAAILGHLLGIDGWQDVCRDAFKPEAAA